MSEARPEPESSATPTTSFINPYHFMPLPDSVDESRHIDRAAAEEQLLGRVLTDDDRANQTQGQRDALHLRHDRYDRNLHSGTIHCTLTTKTPCVFGNRHLSAPGWGAAVENLMLTNKDGVKVPAISGSSLKGMLSSIMEAASGSALRVLNDAALSYRSDHKTDARTAVGMVVEIEENNTRHRIVLPLTLPPIKWNTKHTSLSIVEHDSPWLNYLGRLPDDDGCCAQSLPFYVNGYKGSGKGHKLDDPNGMILEQNPDSFCARNSRQLWVLNSKPTCRFKMTGSEQLRLKPTYRSVADGCEDPPKDWSSEFHYGSKAKVQSVPLSHTFNRYQATVPATDLVSIDLTDRDAIADAISAGKTVAILRRLAAPQWPSTKDADLLCMNQKTHEMMIPVNGFWDAEERCFAWEIPGAERWRNYFIPAERAAKQFENAAEHCREQHGGSRPFRLQGNGWGRVILRPGDLVHMRLPGPRPPQSDCSATLGTDQAETLPLHPETSTGPVMSESNSATATAPGGLIAASSDVVTHDSAEPGVDATHEFMSEDDASSLTAPALRTATRAGEDDLEVESLAISCIWREDARQVSDFLVAHGLTELLPFNSKRRLVTAVEAVLGFVSEDTSDTPADSANSTRLTALAGRIRVSPAYASETNSDNWFLSGGPVSIDEKNWYPLRILSSPKLPCPEMYFSNDSASVVTRGNLRSAAGSPRLQGRKSYWVDQAAASSVSGRYSWQSAPKAGGDYEHKSQKVLVRPLKPGTGFGFQIQYQNLTSQELALLLYAVQPSMEPAVAPQGNQSEFWHRLGLGKPYGMGACHISVSRIIPDAAEARFSSNNLLTPVPTQATPTEMNLPWLDFFASNPSGLTIEPKIQRVISLMGNSRVGQMATANIIPNLHVVRGYPQSVQNIGNHKAGRDTKGYEWFVSRPDFLRPLDPPDAGEGPPMIWLSQYVAEQIALKTE